MPTVQCTLGALPNGSPRRQQSHARALAASRVASLQKSQSQDGTGHSREASNAHGVRAGGDNSDSSSSFHGCVCTKHPHHIAAAVQACRRLPHVMPQIDVSM